MILKVKKLRDGAVLPSKAYPGDAGFDLVAAEVRYFGDGTSLARTWIFFGISVEIPEGYVGLIFPRSSIYRTQVRLSNCVGVIDSGYRGELRAVFDIVRYTDAIRYRRGDKCAQLVILPLPLFEVVEAEELSSTERGGNGFGSSDLRGSSYYIEP